MLGDSFLSENPLHTVHKSAAHASQHSDHQAPTHTGNNERFQYATCPQCRSDRARLTKQIGKNWQLFGIFCPFCGYEDSDVSDH